MKYSTTNLRIRSPLSALSLIAALFIPLILQAEEAGGFLGGFTIGQMDATADDALAWKFVGGYNFNEDFGVELAYVDVDTLKVDAAIASVDFDLSGFTFAGVYRYPVTSQFNTFVKGGGFIWSTDVGLTSNISGRTLLTLDDDGTSFFWGVGAEFEVIKNFLLRAEWERLNFLDSSSGDFLSLGLLYKF